MLESPTAVIGLGVAPQKGGMRCRSQWSIAVYSLHTSVYYAIRDQENETADAQVNFS